jgi:hypothetical protein
VKRAIHVDKNEPIDEHANENEPIHEHTNTNEFIDEPFANMWWVTTSNIYRVFRGTLEDRSSVGNIIIKFTGQKDLALEYQR